MTEPVVSMSGDPQDADEITRSLIHGTHRATADDIANISERMATAPFDSRTVPVPHQLRGMRLFGHELASREPSVIVHLAQRIITERQWATDTTIDRYLGDLRAAVRVPDARLAVYHRRSGACAATWSDTRSFLDPTHQGIRPERHTLVVYSVDRGIIVTGYQASGLDKVSIPGDALWLK